jgi:phosphate transport system protein
MSIRSGLDAELNRMREMLFHMEDLVNTSLRRAMDSLRTRDAELAHAVIREDDIVNELRYEVEQYCVNVLATQQPVARDLRTIMAVVHVAVEMERMGDHAAGVAKITLKVCEEPLLKPLIDLPRMAAVATEMLHDGVRAFVNNDVDKARAIIQRDDEVDGLHEQIFRELLTYMLEDPTTIRRATHLIWASHAVERYADRATNVAERTLFVATGKLADLTSEASEAEGVPGR